MFKTRAVRPTLSGLRTEILDALQENCLVWPAREDCVYGVCRQVLQVKVEFTKSVFTPVERMEKRTIGQFFVVRAVLPPKDEDAIPDLTLTEEEAEIERKHGVDWVVAASVEGAIEALRARGLPL